MSVSPQSVILVVDDRETRRYTVTRQLQKAGYVVREAGTGSETLQHADDKPDLIVLDIKLPDMNGYEVCRRLKSNPRTSTIPVLHLSATFVESENRAQGLESGADGYLTYPVEPRELVANIEALLRIRRAEREALAQRETLRVTLASIGDAVVTADVAGNVIFLNLVAQRLTGWTPEDAIGKPLNKVLHIVDEETGRPIATRTAAALEQGAGFDLPAHYLLVGKDGARRPIDANDAPLRDAENRIVGVVVVLRDITERRCSEAEIDRLLATERRRTEQIRRIAQASLSINSAAGLQHVVTVVTEEARSIIGSHHAVTTITAGIGHSAAVNAVAVSEKYTGTSTVEVPLPDDLTASLQQAISSSKRLPASRRLSAPLIGRDGRRLGTVQLSDKQQGEFTEEDEYILVQLAQGASVAIENAGLVEELRQLDRRKDEFLAMLAHELRNPLAPIRNALEVLNVISSQEPEVRETRQIIERQVEHLVRLVDDLLDMSRISRGLIKLQKQPTDLVTILSRAVEGSRPLIDARRHRLDLRIPDGPVLIDGDTVRLAQVFWNLLNNAAKYTPEGGRIQLRLETTPPTDKSPGQAIVHVVDTGMGIPAPMLAKVFDLFTQVDEALDRAQGGLGIGLTLVRRLTEMHGGTVSARSEGRGQGSEFVVSLPLVASPKAAVGDRPVAPNKRSAARRILVVDDNRDSADSLATMLRLFGNDVRTAYEGRQALLVADAYRPDVVFLDIGLPGMDGYAVARQIRASPKLDQALLVALTGYGTDEDRRLAKEAGFNTHLVKPVQLDTLQNVLASV